MTTNKKFISFIAPIYNVNKYLPDFLESFLQFKHLDFEIILVDDRSIENPDAIIKKYSVSLPIRTIKNEENIEQGFSRNVGMKNMDKRATHFMFIDPDDSLSPNVEGIILNSMIDVPVIFDFFIAKSIKNTKVKKMWKYNFYKGSGAMPVWGHVFPISKSNIKFTARTYEDHKWNSMATKDGFKISTNFVIVYRLRASSTLGESHKSKNKAMQIMDHANELILSKNSGLIINYASYRRNLIFAKIEYLYIPKKNRAFSFPIEFSWTTNLMIFMAVILQKITGFWFIVSIITSKNKFE